MTLPVNPAALRGLYRELQSSAGDRRHLAVDGARELAPLLARELARGGDPTAVNMGGLDGAAALVYVLAGAPDESDEQGLRRANRARVPIVCVVAGRAGEPVRVPYVLATDVVPVPPGAGFPIEAIAEALAARLGEEGTALAARLPTLRSAVCERLIRTCAHRGAIYGAAAFVPGADLPVLLLSQLRLVARIAAAHGRAIDAKLVPELVAVVGGAFGFRTAARELVGLVPRFGWAVRGAVAALGARAVGEAALARFRLQRDEAATDVP
ncbi:MAG TPA: hypothetical protein VGF23_03025 [Gaiellaceae bacterium]